MKQGIDIDHAEDILLEAQEGTVLVFGQIFTLEAYWIPRL
jgi:hypothetical protein